MLTSDNQCAKAPPHLSSAPCILTIQVYESGSELYPRGRRGSVTLDTRLLDIAGSNPAPITSYMHLNTEVAPCERATFYIKLLHLRLWYATIDI